MYPYCLNKHNTISYSCEFEFYVAMFVAGRDIPFTGFLFLVFMSHIRAYRSAVISFTPRPVSSGGWVSRPWRFVEDKSLLALPQIEPRIVQPIATAIYRPHFVREIRYKNKLFHIACRLLRPFQFCVYFSAIPRGFSNVKSFISQGSRKKVKKTVVLDAGRW